MKPILANLHDPKIRSDRRISVIKLGNLALAVLALLLIGGQAWGATYYLRADGAAANKAAASGPCSTQANAMSVATHNTEAAGFADGDTIDLCDDGGNYTTKLIPVAGNGETITYQPAAGEGPVFNGSTSVLAGTWSDQGSNVWRQTLTGRVGNVYALWYNTSSYGIKQADTSTVNSIGDWSYLAEVNLNITNGNFSSWTGDNPDSWTVGGESGADPMVTEVSGKCRIYTSTSSVTIAKSGILTVGHTYTITFDITASVAGGLKLNDGAGQLTTFSGVGAKTYTWTQRSGTYFELQRNGAPTDVTIDNVVVKETGNYLYVYATESPATYYSVLAVDKDSFPTAIDFSSQAGKIIVNNLSFQYFASAGYSSPIIKLADSKYADVTYSTFNYTGAAIAITGTQAGTWLIDHNTFLDGYYSTTIPSIWNACKNLTASNNTINHAITLGGAAAKGMNGIAIYEGSGAGWEVPTGCSLLDNAISNIKETAISGYDATNVDVGGQDISLTISGGSITGGQYLNGDYDAIGIGGIAESVAAAWKNILIIGVRIDGYGNGGVNFSNFSGAESTAVSNVISNSGGVGYGAIKVSGGSTIANNTIYNVYDTGAGWGAGIWVRSTNGALISNNLIHTVDTGSEAIHVEDGITTTGSHNLAYNITGDDLYNFTDASLVAADPLFINAASGDFHLQPTSPAIGSGVPILTYAQWIASGGDFAGKNPTAGTFSIGAYQYQAKGSNFPALPIWDSFVRHSKSTDAGSYAQ